MARQPSAKVRMTRDAFTPRIIAVADGMFEWGKDTIQVAATRAPDSPYDPYPTGEGLPKQGGVLAYVGNKKVAGWHQRGGQPKKPRSLRTTAKQHSVVVAVGFGYPGRFAEGGTIRQAPQPFLEPTKNERASSVPDYVRRAVAKVR